MVALIGQSPLIVKFSGAGTLVHSVAWQKDWGHSCTNLRNWKVPMEGLQERMKSITKRMRHFIFPFFFYNCIVLVHNHCLWYWSIYKAFCWYDDMSRRLMQLMWYLGLLVHGVRWLANTKFVFRWLSNTKFMLISPTREA